MLVGSVNLVAPKTALKFGCVGGDRYLIPFVLENIADDLPNIRFVVNNQN